MKTAPNTAQEEEHRGVGEQHQQARPREVDAVPGADEHAVEDEDDPRDGLEEGRGEEDGDEEVVDVRVGGEDGSEQRGGGGEARAGQDPRPQAPPGHPGGQSPGGPGVTGPEGSAGQGLGGDGDRVEHERQEGPQGHRELVRGDAGGTGRVGTGTAGDHVGGEDDGGAQGEGPDDEGDPGPGCSGDTGGRGTQAGVVSTGPADEHPDQGRRHRRLGQHRPDRRPGDTPSDAVHEHHVEGEVAQVPDHGHDQGRTGVLEPAQDTGDREDDQQRGRPGEGDGQVVHGVLLDGAGDVEEPDQPGGQRDAGDGHDRADEDGEPGAVDAEGERTALVAGAEAPGDAGGGAVGQEDAQADGRLEDHGCDADAGELGGPEVPHDGCVPEQEQRLGDQGEERGDRQAQDLPVGLRPHSHEPLPSSNSPNGPGADGPGGKVAETVGNLPGGRPCRHTDRRRPGDENVNRITTRKSSVHSCEGTSSQVRGHIRPVWDSISTGLSPSCAHGSTGPPRGLPSYPQGLWTRCFPRGATGTYVRAVAGASSPRAHPRCAARPEPLSALGPSLDGTTQGPPENQPRDPAQRPSARERA